MHLWHKNTLKGIFFNQALQKLSKKTLLIQDPDFTHSAHNFFVNHEIQFTLNLLCLVAFLCFSRENFCIFPKCILKFTYNPSINVTANGLKTCNSTLNSLAKTRILKYVGIQNTNVGICFRIRKTLTNFLMA